MSQHSFFHAEVVRSCCFPAHWGWAGLAVTTRGLLTCVWPWKRREEAVAEMNTVFMRAGLQGHRVGLVWLSEQEIKKDLILGQAAEALLAFLRGSSQPLEIFPIDVRWFSAWRRRVYEVVRTIPRGEVRSYGWVAERCEKRGAARAVGNALAANPLLLFIPCHRVIRADGSLGNYGNGGPIFKEQLLFLEKKPVEVKKGCGTGTARHKG